MISKIFRILSCFELRPLKTLRAIKRLPRYFFEFLKLRKSTKWPVRAYPCFFDRDIQSATLGEYFWQDLFVAKRIIQTNPARHIDVGSRIDGFVAHLACVRTVEVFDIRPMEHAIDNVVFQRWDITNPNEEFFGISDCVSCLHTLEHIGLGRYGDKIDIDGWKFGLKNLSKILQGGGVLWLSVPIGLQRIEFNAHRVFDPFTIIKYATTLDLNVKEFSYIDNTGINISNNLLEDMKILSQAHYSLGIFCFLKPNSHRET